ncbi:unnamed protein product [Brachionus calyciflorus]|uniref:Endonuclease/exonuclease/phosphatase domain-containing protein n=1 Tax=Brachionus calyciflorus TaxID=104777 RepID=A0A813NER1_9BILA|nr:unnamed protein product [Brachionus calyciflorus]
MLKFDDNSNESYDCFKSDLLILESEIKYNLDRNLPFVIMGDWNADLSREKRFDKLFKEFILKKNLQISDFLDSKYTGFTYRNGSYRATLDHIVWSQSESSFEILDSSIENIAENLSDHLPVTVRIKINSKLEEKELEHNFYHRVNWESKEFIQFFNQFSDQYFEDFNRILENETT